MEKMCNTYDLRAYIQHRFCDPCIAANNHLGGMQCRNCGIRDVICVIERGSVDAEPIRAHWIKRSDGCGYQCPECRNYVEDKSKYCPHCGERIYDEKTN